MKQIVLPGDVISDSEERIPNTYTDAGKTYAMVASTFDKSTKKVVPLEGVWSPRSGDVVIGIVTQAGRKNMFILDLAHHLNGMLIEKYPKFPIAVGDIIEAEVDRIENRRTVQLFNPKQLKGGKLITIGATKVHRVIGKSNTMIKQICEMTKCNIVVGENGVVWISGENQNLAAATIMQVERAAHVSGLTEIIKNMLIKNGK